MNPLQRAARTFLQAFLASLMLSFGTLATGKVPDAPWLYAALASAVFGALVAVLSWLQNALEDQAIIPTTLGKAPRKKALTG